MIFDYNVLDETEKIIFALRSLYQEAGYRRYRMGKFEEYDLYAGNKEFLVSDSVITFTDTDGKLMALKPDVTLSIIKNDRDHEKEVRKLCYNESVYRVSRGTGAFREIMQTGLECIGDVGYGSVREVLMLALKSLSLLSDEYILEVSGPDMQEAVISSITGDLTVQKEIMKCLGEKNRHGIRTVLEEREIPAKKANDLLFLMELSGSPAEVIKKLSAFIEKKEAPFEEKLKASAEELTAVLSSLADTVEGRHILVDFSLTGDTNYYNGILFRGFLSGIPESVLSGGRYDRLMKKMGRKSGAVGFAVYLDLLERLNL